MSKATYGDIVFVKHFLYKHFGIYIADDCIIHYDGKIDDILLRNMRVRETNVDRFLAGKEKYYVRKFKSKVYSPEETVKRAREKIGSTEFDLLLNNCESFANWCKTGKSSSTQVNLALTTVILYKLSIMNKNKH